MIPARPITRTYHPPASSADGMRAAAAQWPTSSGMAAVIFAMLMAVTQAQRFRITKVKLPPFLILTVAVHWIAALMLLANAVVPALEGVALFKAALTLSLGMVMWAFVRRVSSLLGNQPSEDWDPKRG